MILFEKISWKNFLSTGNHPTEVILNENSTTLIVGQNGAGKSTLVGILSGLYQPDSGEISVNGKPEIITSPRKAIELGIGTVHQHSTLVPTLTTLENLMLGQAWHQSQNASGIYTKFKSLSAKLGISIDPDVPAGKLALGQQQQIEILKALWKGGGILILDEPTSMLDVSIRISIMDLMTLQKQLEIIIISLLFIGKYEMK